MRPDNTAGTYAATGAGTSGRVRPSSAMRSSGVMSVLCSLQIGHERLGVRALHHLHKLPAIRTPRIEDLLRGVNEQRNGYVLPGRHDTTLAGDH